MSLLITGGAGYIGSHTCLELLNRGYDLVVIDNLDNSKEEALLRVKELTGKSLRFYKDDLLDKNALVHIFQENQITGVIHFAGLKAVGESNRIPLRYYDNNITGTLHLCQVMEQFNVRNLVFSSSATVYGQPRQVPITEDLPLQPTNPYGRTKYMIELILGDLYASNRNWNIILLRYFNPVGAHPSGRIGEDPNGIPNNLFPYITQVAVGKLEKLSVFGSDYPTPDGTGVRDYIHVVDLALGHVQAVQKLYENPGLLACNLGTGNGYSVLDVIRAFEQASGRSIPYVIQPRRQGDVASCYADPAKAGQELHWSAEKNLFDMCADSWRWQAANPDGYDK
ncbi:MAG TPA: UDP-glucose 4-epimerase GalE [bacterium]|nr:UDP-glucose 4-epimerase GalE [bacterium]HPN43093.1 UDP-glucose 4-epimerase GalE [bacterium]